MAYPVSYREQPRRTREDRGFRTDRRSFGEPANDNMPRPANDNEPARSRLPRQPFGRKIPNNAKAFFKFGFNMSPIGRAWRFYQTASGLFRLGQWGKPDPGGDLELNGPWTLQNWCNTTARPLEWSRTSTGTGCAQTSGIIYAVDDPIVNIGASQVRVNVWGRESIASATQHRGRRGGYYTMPRSTWNQNPSAYMPRYTQPKNPADNKVWPDVNPAIDPDAMPILKPAPDPQPIPYKALPARRPNPYRSIDTQRQVGYGTATRDRGVSFRIEAEITPNGQPNVRLSRDNLFKRTKRAPGERELKMVARKGSGVAYTLLKAGLGHATEILDFVSLLYSLIPAKDKYKWMRENGIKEGQKMTGFDVFHAVYDNWDKIDPEEFMVEFVKMQLTDAAFGALGQALAKSGVGGTGGWDTFASDLYYQAYEKSPTDHTKEYFKREFELDLF